MISYEQDLYAWTKEHVALLQTRQFDKLDVPNLIEELEYMAKRDKRELFSRMILLFCHLLKWQFQTTRRSRSWEKTIIEQRHQLEFILADSPTLYHKLAEKWAILYIKAVKQASRETKLSLNSFPATCPYILEQVLDDDFYPNPTNEENHDE